MIKLPSLFIWGCAVLVACSSAQEPQAESFKVEYAGALMNVMHKGDISAKDDLRDLSSQKHLFALGAVEDLQGEILVLDGKPIISYVEVNENGVKHLKIDNSFTSITISLTMVLPVNLVSVPY